MVDFQMYSKIQQKKQQGFSRDAVARQLELNWRKYLGARYKKWK